VLVCFKALESLNKKDMTEIKSYGRPPMLVEKVMEAVMILRGSEPTWAESKKQLGELTHVKDSNIWIRKNHIHA
jgi:dynein heavy chain